MTNSSFYIVELLRSQSLQPLGKCENPTIPKKFPCKLSFFFFLNKQLQKETKTFFFPVGYGSFVVILVIFRLLDLALALPSQADVTTLISRVERRLL